MAKRLGGTEDRRPGDRPRDANGRAAAAGG
jgi:hypothetical protein